MKLKIKYKTRQFPIFWDEGGFFVLVAQSKFIENEQKLKCPKIIKHYFGALYKFNFFYFYPFKASAPPTISKISLVIAA